MNASLLNNVKVSVMWHKQPTRTTTKGPGRQLWSRINENFHINYNASLMSSLNPCHGVSWTSCRACLISSRIYFHTTKLSPRANQAHSLAFFFPRLVTLTCLAVQIFTKKYNKPPPPIPSHPPTHLPFQNKGKIASQMVSHTLLWAGTFCVNPDSDEAGEIGAKSDWWNTFSWVWRGRASTVTWRD